MRRWSRNYLQNEIEDAIDESGVHPEFLQRPPNLAGPCYHFRARARKYHRGRISQRGRSFAGCCYGDNDEAVAKLLGVSRSLVTRKKNSLSGGENVTNHEFTTQTEKRRLIREAIEDDPDASNREIADRTGVSHPTVGDIRNTIENPGDPTPSAETFDENACNGVGASPGTTKKANFN